MIRGYNFPSGTAEKVTIDGNKVTEKMSLYSFRHQVTLDVNDPPKVSGYTYQGELYDGSKLYMKKTLTEITNGSTNSSDGCTGTVLLIKPDGTQLSVAIPTYTIPTERSETGTNPDSYVYKCDLSPSPDGEDIYLRLERKFEDISGSNTHDHSTYYQSIYKLNIHSSSLTWTTKAIEISLGRNKYAHTNFIIENNYIYVCAHDGGNPNVNYIYGYEYSDTSYEFQKVSTNNIYHYYVDSSDNRFLARKGASTYIYFWVWDSKILTNEWISITRNSDGTYSEASGTAYLSGRYKLSDMFMLNGEIYFQMLGDAGAYPPEQYEGCEGFHIYKLNSDNSAWKVVYSIANATSKNIVTTSYFDNVPNRIIQGRSDSPSAVRFNGTFDLMKFSPETLDYSQIPTPTITSMRSDETWYYYNYKYNNIGQKLFFFRVVVSGDSNSITQYKCVLESINDEPVLYSTFMESDILKLI